MEHATRTTRRSQSSPERGYIAFKQVGDPQVLRVALDLSGRPRYRLAAPVDLFQLAQSAVGRIVVRSALNPMLWMCGLIALPCFSMALRVRDDRPMMWAFMIVGGLVVLVTCGIAGGFAIFKPEKLQSEDYQLRHQSIQMLQGRDGPQVIEAVAVIANPALPALPVPGTEAQ